MRETTSSYRLKKCSCCRVGGHACWGEGAREAEPLSNGATDFKVAAQVQSKSLIEFLLRLIADGSQSGAIVTNNSPASFAWLHWAGKLSIAL